MDCGIADCGMGILDCGLNPNLELFFGKLRVLLVVFVLLFVESGRLWT